MIVLSDNLLFVLVYENYCTTFIALKYYRTIRHIVPRCTNGIKSM